MGGKYSNFKKWAEIISPPKYLAILVG